MSDKVICKCGNYLNKKFKNCGQINKHSNANETSCVLGSCLNKKIGYSIFCKHHSSKLNEGVFLDTLGKYYE